MTRPQGHGHWTLSTSHLDPKSPAPQLWCTWELEFTIQDIIALQDFKLAKGVTTYPVTLLWYLRMRDPSSDRWSFASDLYPFADAGLLPACGSSPTRIELSSLPDDPLALESNSNARPERARQKDLTNVKSQKLFPGLKGRSQGRPLRRRYLRKRSLRPEATRKSVRGRKPKSRE
jgi:hypothetical protein